MWSDVATAAGASGAPLLVGAIGWLECRLAAEHPVGTHTLFVGEVLVATTGEAAPPLLRVGGSYRAAS